MFAVFGRRFSNLYLERSHHDDLTTSGENIRDWFSKTDFTHINPYPRHTHGESAAVRSVGSNFIELVSQLSSGQPFYFQGSVADQRRGRETSREWFWAKDLSMPVCLPPTSDGISEQVCAMVDVDEYVDMPTMLAVNFRPYLLYTFVPNRAAHDVGDHAYRFDRDGSVEYVVSGGGTYRHHLWDYSHDSLKVEGTEWLWLQHGLVFPIRVRYVAFYKVERRNIDADHQVVLLSPMKRWCEIVNGGSASLADAMIDAPKLVRFNPVVGDFVRVEVKTSDGLCVSTARVGDFSSALVPRRVDEEASLKSALTKDKLTISMVKSSFENSSVTDKFGVEVMTAYHRSLVKDTVSRVFTTTEGVRAYQFLPKLADLDPDARPTMRAFMKPIVHGGFCPADVRSSDQRGVDRRIKAVKTTTSLTPMLKATIDAFVKRIATETLVPVDEDVVRERQSRPTQRAILELADFQSQSGVSRTFVKRQAETKIGDPRIITTIDGSDKRDYSMFTYALSELLKKLAWFISGMKPREIAERVAVVAQNDVWLAETDFSRMDGHISEVPRYLEMELMKALFAPSQHKRMLELMRKQTMLQCTTRNGVHYNSGLSRGSGSPETSPFNTVLTGFVMYLSFFLDGYDHSEAWVMLNGAAACCGDDAIGSGLKQVHTEKAASMVGQKLTISIRRVGDTVSFLSRHYGPDVWFGDTDSCCDFKRQLSKFHLATYVEQDIKARETKLREKSFAYFLTDEHSPVLGDFVKKVLTLAPVQHGEGVGRTYTNILRIWNSEIPKQDQYPSNVDGYSWKRELFEQQLPDFCIENFIAWLITCKTLEEIMSPPEPVVIEAKHPGGSEAVEIDGDIIQPSVTQNTEFGPRHQSPGRRGRRSGKAVKRTERGRNPRRKAGETKTKAKVAQHKAKN
jgi:hypothetical protein